MSHIIRVRFFHCVGRKPIAYFCVNQIRVISILPYENVKDLKADNPILLTNLIANLISRNFPRFVNFKVENDLFPYSKLIKIDYEYMLRFMRI